MMLFVIVVGFYFNGLKTLKEFEFLMEFNKKWLHMYTCLPISLDTFLWNTLFVYYC